jgi:hypothetical protein
LWLLGLFLAGGFNGNFVYLAQLQVGWRDKAPLIHYGTGQYGNGRVAIAGLLGLAVFIVIFAIANWAKVLFVLHARNVLGLEEASTPDDPASPRKLIRQSRTPLVSVMGVSAITMVSLAVISGVLFGTPTLLSLRPGSLPGMWLLAGLVFIVLVLFFSCLNIFSTFFIVLYRYRARKAVALALDLLVSRWQPIIAMAMLLIGAYAACFFIGVSLVFILKSVAASVLLPFTRFGLANPGDIVGFITVLSGILLWCWLAVVNVFFNLSLLLLFAELVRPPKDPELANVKQIHSVVPEVG